MHTHFCGFQRKNFYSVKRSPHLFGIAKSNDTLFLRKKEKIFFQLRDSLLLLAPKVSSLIPTENSQMHTLNLEKFLPFAYLELRGQNTTCFLENSKNF